LLVIAIIVGLLVSFLLAYKMFIYDKKENKDNDIVNKNDMTEEALKKIDEKTKEINTLINNFNYNYLISRGMELKSEDITKETILNMVLSEDMIIDEKNIIISIGHSNDKLPTIDSTGKKYPNYNSNEKLVCPKEGKHLDYDTHFIKTVSDFQKTMQELGLAVDEIEKMDANLWNCMNTNDVIYYIKVYSEESLKNKIVKQFGTKFASMFDESFYTFLPLNFIYDKNIKKAFTIPSTAGGTSPSKVYLLLDVKDNDDTMVLKFVSGFLMGDDADIQVEGMKKRLYENQDKYDKHELTFKKENGNYIFDNIKKI
jgi:hypothetical protein